ncbi:hypothetical protein QBC32DRAFT_365694 [Pseudoneurospora amorphoporcata]|uniref:C2H2-type domain-containing protein n=1 Tax=Pseudoneurospora amorphoporcata TaxID=241081 RepID=A0AAN6SAY9_9PEZI|nr:hypothetical protein QBC32DRAFT_365694 [Pseudoneurospora amorphoporcata]
MAPSQMNVEYDRIKSGSGRRYAHFQYENKRPLDGFGGLYPEGYAPKVDREKRWPCPIVCCDKAFKQRRELGQHFSTVHRGAALHDLRNGQFTLIRDEGDKPPCVRSRSNKPPSPILAPLPPSSPASSALRSSSVERGSTPGDYIKREHSISYQNGQRPDFVILDSEDDEHTSSTQDVGDVVEEETEEEEYSDEDLDNVSSDGAGPDKESVTSVSDEEEDDAVQTPDRNESANENLESGQYYNYAASPVWRYINKFTPTPIPVRQDTCLRELLTLPLAREFPRSWRVRLGKPRFATDSFNLKMMTAAAIFLTGDDMDVQACTAFGCLNRHPLNIAQALTDFATDSDVVHGMLAFPRCVVPQADFLERSATLKERLNGTTCCNAYYYLGKKPEPKLIYVAGYPLPYPITPENPPRAAPAPARKDHVASPTSGQPQQEGSPYNGQSSPLKARSTSESLKRKTSPCAASDDYAYDYRLSTDPGTPAKWESMTGVLHQRECFSEPAVAYSPSYVRFHTSLNKRIKLFSSPCTSGSGSSPLADFRVISLENQHNSVQTKSKAAQAISLPVSKSRSYVCSVASGGPVRVYLDKGKGGGQERPFDIMEGGVWVVEKGWACGMEAAVGAVVDDGGDAAMGDEMHVAASVHVTGVFSSPVVAGKTEKEDALEVKSEQNDKQETAIKKREVKKANKEIKEKKKKQEKEERKREKEAKRQVKKEEKRREKEVKREKKQVKNEKKEKKEKQKAKQN